MPVWLRKITYSFLSEQKKKEYEQLNTSTNSKNTKKIDFTDPITSKKMLSDVSPNVYKTKASKK